MRPGPLAASAAAAALLLLTACGGSSDGEPSAGWLGSPGADDRAAEADAEDDSKGEEAAEAEAADAGQAGIAALPGDEISRLAAEALASVSALRMTGGGPDPDIGGMDMDIHIGMDEKCTAEIEFWDSGVAMEILADGDEFWIKANRAFWRELGVQDPAFLADASGMYIEGTDDMAELKSFCSLQDFLDEMGNPDDYDHSTTIKGETREYRGIPVITLYEEHQDGIGHSEVLVATEGEPYVLHMTAGDLTMDLSDFNVPVQVTAPPASQILDLSQYTELQL